MPYRSTSIVQRGAASGSVRPALDEQTSKTIFASGSALGALAMSSCCNLPLVLDC